MVKTRQLAAIMFTDIVGYTKLMGSDEDRALRVLNLNRELHIRHIEIYGGKLLKELGDGMLVSFDSVYSAVKCAMALILESKESAQYQLSIGIHLGEVLFSENDVFGDGVNIASRIESLAQPNSILISQKVWEELENHKDIQGKLLGTFNLKNDRKPRTIFAITNEGISVPNIRPTGKNDSSSFAARFKWPIWISSIIALIALASGWYFTSKEKTQRKEWALSTAIPKIEKYMENYVFPGNSVQSWETLDLADQANEVLEDNAVLTRYYNGSTKKVYVRSVPEGADIYFRPYSGDSTWRFMGQTPMDIVVPRCISQIRLESKPFVPYMDLAWAANFQNADTLVYELTDQKMPGMVRIPEIANYYKIKAAPATLRLVGLEEAPDVKLGSFFMDQYEVTNREYKKFVDAGGYSNQSFWDYPFITEGKSIDFQEAMRLFVDKTGLPGPSTWEGGSHNPDEADYPVSGVSWYEAAAYASFSGKRLPSIYHWDRAALTWGSSAIAKASNLDSDEVLRVGIASNRFGVYDLGGNVREWCYNQTSGDQRFILGGGWSDLPYAFNDAYGQQPMDRSEINGFRCISIEDDTGSQDLAFAAVKRPYRDFYSDEIVSDQLFETYLSQFNYDQTPLDIEAIKNESTDEWNQEIVEINAAYGNERMQVFLFTPKNTPPPYQTLVYFPGSGAIHNNSSENLSPHRYILNSGRAIAYPILKSTFERRDDLTSDYPNTSVHWKNHVIMWVKDFSRTLDYLESREDINMEKVGYFGASWGGAMGSIVPAVEKRLKLNILIVAGLNMQKALPEIDEVQYLSRIKTPTIMINGKYDFFFPYESSQKPFYDLLGTPDEDKALKIYEGGHSVPRVELIKEVLGWMDRYWGPVMR
jgi:formylglycine-generating enzyme required for sulfatase activity/dienelactone hydrolase